MVDRRPLEPADPPPLSEDIIELIASGVDVYVGTRDASLQAEAMLAIGSQVHPDLRTFTVYLPEATAGPTLRNLKQNGEIAIALVRPMDHKSVQLKGKMISLRPSVEADRPIQQMGRAALVEQFAAIGIPRPLTRRLVWWPSVAVDVEVRDVYQQTPGPGAGELLARGSL